MGKAARLSPQAAASSGAAVFFRRGGERGVDIGDLGALVVELGLVRERIAEARRKAGKPARDFSGGAAFLSELDVEPAQRRLRRREMRPSGVTSLSKATGQTALRGRA